MHDEQPVKSSNFIRSESSPAWTTASSAPMLGAATLVVIDAPLFDTGLEPGGGIEIVHDLEVVDMGVDRVLVVVLWLTNLHSSVSADEAWNVTRSGESTFIWRQSTMTASSRWF